mgnify:CR=1 FL=1
MSCKHCKHYQPVSSLLLKSAVGAGGFCHRNPPIPIVSSQGIGSAWPPVPEGESCGEFFPRIEASEAPQLDPGAPA